MITPKSSTRFLALLISCALLAAPGAAQQPKISPPQKEATRADANATAPTFDTLLAADSYKVYGELRNFGQVIRSGSVSDILDPIMKLAGPPKEFKSLVKFANAHAESLTTSRVLFAAWPARAKLPQFLMAIEFSSPEEARKFEPQLNEFLPKILPPPAPSPAPKASPAAAVSPQGSPTPETEKKEAEKKTQPSDPKEEQPAPPQFVVKQAGNLVFISDTAFTFKALRPKDSKLLSEDPNFRQIHDRFATEPLFLCFNIALEDKNRVVAEQKAAELTEPTNQKPGDEPGEMEPPEMTPDNETPEPPAPAPQPEASLEVRVTPAPGQPALGVAQNQAAPPPSPNFDSIFYLLMGGIAGGPSRYPDAVGVGISFDSDGYIVRALLINGADAKATLIPFIPQLISGPSLVLESPSVLPADTEFFVAASLDATQIYEGMVKTFKESFTSEHAVYRGGRFVSGRADVKPPESPFVDIEKTLGIKIKEDLLPILGNEIAVSLPVSTMTGAPEKQAAPEQTPTATSKQDAAVKRGPSPVILISVKDKQAARTLVPRIIDNLGFKGASTLAQTERHGDTEIVSYANALAYAFIGDFFVFSTDVGATRHIVDSYVNHQTLASDTHFRNSTRWQPRQVVGEVYVSPALMDSYRTWANDSTALISDATRDFLMRLAPTSEPVTYALSNDGAGSLHELHVPKNLVLMAVAGISSEANQSPLMRNEMMARGILSMIASAETRYQDSQGKGSYATLDQLTAHGLVPKEMLESNGYKFELTVTGNKFEASAVPTEYGKTGKLSYFVDQTGIVRGGDHGGGPATVADRRVQ